MMMPSKLPVTVVLAVKNEAANISKCLNALRAAEKILVIDSNSTDGTVEVAKAFGAEVVQFIYEGGYPKKRQWAVDTLDVDTPWILFIDADEVVPAELWEELRIAIDGNCEFAGFSIKKGFHFLGKRMKFGGFSHEAVLLVRQGSARFEKLIDDTRDALDMEVHERVIVDGRIGRLKTPLIHEDFKGLEAYIARHNKYSTWEARLRYKFLRSGNYGQETITPKLLGNSQERRRWIKAFVIRLPFEPLMWFIYHYFVRLGVVEGRPGLIACQIRMSYIQQVRAKVHEHFLSTKPA